MTIEVANRLIELRKRAGLSQEELADKIGVSRQAVSKWERAEACPDTENLIELSNLYGVSVDSILKGNKDTEAETVEAEVVDVDDRSKEEVVIEKHAKKSVASVILSGVLFPVLLLTYLLLGFFWRGPEGQYIGWACGWTLFLFGIFLSSIPHAIRVKHPSHVAFAPLVVATYVATSMIVQTYTGVLIWHPLWVIFFTIPIYHVICSAIEAARK